MPINETVTVSGRGDTSNAVGALDRMGRSALNLNMILDLVGRAARAVADGIKATAGAALEQERIFGRLAGAMDRAGIGYAANSAALSDYLAQMQRVTRFGDTDMAQALTTISQLTGALQPSFAELTEFGRISADIAEATGQDLQSAANAVGQAAAGNVRSLMTLVPAMRDEVRAISEMSDAGERGAEAMRILQGEFAGAATQISELDLGLSRIRNGWSDLQEAVGSFVTESEGAQTALAQIANLIDNIGLLLSGGTDDAAAFGDGIDAMARASGNAIVSLAEAVIQAFAVVQREARNLQRDSAMRRIGSVNELFSAPGVVDPTLALQNRRRNRLLRDAGLPEGASDADIRAEQARLTAILDDRDNAVSESQRMLDELRSGFLTNTQGGLGGGGRERVEIGNRIGTGSGGRTGEGGAGGGGSSDSVGYLDAAIARVTDLSARVAALNTAWKEGENSAKRALDVAYGGEKEKSDEGSKTVFGEMTSEIDEFKNALDELAAVGGDAMRDLENAAGDFGLTLADAFGQSIVGAENFGDAAARAAASGASGFAKEWAKKLAIMGASFLFIPGMRPRGIGLLAAAAALGVGGGAVGALGDRVGRDDRGGSAASTSAGIAPTAIAPIIETTSILVLEGEVLSRATSRSAERGGRSRI